jgi:hypothetical protein
MQRRALGECLQLTRIPPALAAWSLSFYLLATTRPDTTGFSRVEPQLLPTPRDPCPDTTGFSRVEPQLLPTRRYRDLDDPTT